MVIAYHLIWTRYGWWLPNDLRGSMSRGIASDIISDLGKLHYGRKRIQPASKDIRGFYADAAAALEHPLLSSARLLWRSSALRLNKRFTPAVTPATRAPLCRTTFTCSFESTGIWPRR
ncbi:MAG TPA: hypothetical protein VLI90_10835 [Tepidisphaeraceae bacterium]|nr:hypothetical protein [Tepidisphaeraceae bacterium]